MTNKLCPALCCAAVLLAGWEVDAAQPVNLLTNGGFEDGMSGWMPHPRHELITDKTVAHSGEVCLSGTVTAPNQALRLRQRVPVRACNRYELVFWAKADKACKIVVAAIQPGSSVRQSVAPFTNLSTTWGSHRTVIPVYADGMLALEFIAPSSFAAPAGQIWLDDVALLETRMPPVTSVSQGVGFNDEPAAALAADGSIYVAYNSFRDGADSLQVTRHALRDGRWEQLAAWQIVGGKGTYVLRPQVVNSGAGVTVVYAAEHKKNWDVYMVACGPDGPGEPMAITSDEGVDVDPAVASNDETLWVAWESNRDGSRRILVTAVRNGKPAEAVSLSPAGASSYDPSITVLDDSEVCVAWHSFQSHNYDIYLNRKPAGRTWGQATRLTQAAGVDRHAQLFSRGNELWMAYEHAQTERYNITRTDRRRVIVAKVTQDALQVPKELAGKSPLAARCEAAQASFDAAGRLWLTMLKPRLPRSGWDTFITCYADGRWVEPHPLSSLKSMDRQAQLVVTDRGPVVVFLGDDVPQSWSGEDKLNETKSDVFLAAGDSSSLSAVSPIVLEQLVEPDDPFEAATLRVERGEDTPTPSIEYDGQTLKLYYGDLHEHTDVSVCNRLGDQSIDESYQHMRDIARHDFACVTDHGYNISPYLWSYVAKLAWVNDDPDRFLTFLGEEWTSTFEQYSEAHPFGFYGHRNLIFADSYFPKWFNARNRQTPAQLWEELRKMNANFINIPHQLADTGNVPVDWNFHDERAQPAAEIFQARGSYEYKGTPREAGRSTPQPGYFIQDAWARGIVIGVIASPDHGGGYGKACVFAPELTREAILDAIRARHCYGTTAAKIFLDVRIDGHLMGEKSADPAGTSIEVKITARCPQSIDRVEICRNNQFIYANEPDGTEATLTFVDRDPLPGRSYYYVRVVQEDEEIAWSSPVWFGCSE